MSTNYNYYIIADHFKTACFCIADGVLPSGKQRGYILRRLIRRCLLASVKEGIDILSVDYYDDLTKEVIDMYSGVYNEIEDVKSIIVATFLSEAAKFQKAISTGEKQWQKILQSSIQSSKTIDVIKSADITFDLYQKSGVPFEVSQEFCQNNNIPFSNELVEQNMSKHQELSRSSSSGQFKSGLGENNDKTTRLHTTTHILHSVLRSKFGESVRQMGSAITSEKARFDFALDTKIDQNDLQQITTLVQNIIDKNLYMEVIETSESSARELGAIGLFGEKYGEKVTVYSLLGEHGEVFSREFCGGPHIKSTSEIGKFVILKEKSISAGVRRLEFDLE